MIPLCWSDSISLGAAVNRNVLEIPAKPCRGCGSFVLSSLATGAVGTYVSRVSQALMVNYSPVNTCRIGVDKDKEL